MKDAWLSSTLSNRAFHEMIKRLENNNIVQCEKKVRGQEGKGSNAQQADFRLVDFEIAKNINN
jgi:hypothetical protein